MFDQTIAKDRGVRLKRAVWHRLSLSKTSLSLLDIERCGNAYQGLLTRALLQLVSKQLPYAEIQENFSSYLTGSYFSQVLPPVCSSNGRSSRCKASLTKSSRLLFPSAPKSRVECSLFKGIFQDDIRAHNHVDTAPSPPLTHSLRLTLATTLHKPPQTLNLINKKHPLPITPPH